MDEMDLMDEMDDVYLRPQVTGHRTTAVSTQHSALGKTNSKGKSNANSKTKGNSKGKS